MSTSSTLSNLAHRDGRRDDRTRRRSTALGIRVAFGRDALTRELAAGAPPALSPELTARAAQLVTPRHRRQAARAWRRAIQESRQPRLARSNFSIIRRGAVIDAEQTIRALIGRLNDTRPVAAQGMAMAHRLLTDGAESPLYAPAEPGTLRRQIKMTIEVLSAELTDRPTRQA